MCVWRCNGRRKSFRWCWAGRPAQKEIDKGKDVAIDVFHKGKEILHAHQEDKPKLASVISSVPVVKGIEAKAHAVKDVADKAKAVEQKAVEVRDTIKGTGEKVVNALENVGGKAKEAATGGLSHLTEAWHARKEEQEKAAREMLMVGDATSAWRRMIPGR